MRELVVPFKTHTREGTREGTRVYNIAKKCGMGFEGNDEFPHEFLHEYGF